MTDALTKIEELQETADSYFIDYFPKIVTSTIYFKFEDYFIDHYLPSYSKKLIRIVFKLMCYFETEAILLTELPCRYTGPLQKYDTYKNLSHLPLEELAYIINEVSTNGGSTVQILLKSTDYCNFSISDAFNVGLSTNCSEIIDLLSMLVTQEGLFMRKVIE